MGGVYPRTPPCTIASPAEPTISTSPPSPLRRLVQPNRDGAPGDSVAGLRPPAITAADPAPPPMEPPMAAPLAPPRMPPMMSAANRAAANLGCALTARRVTFPIDRLGLNRQRAVGETIDVKRTPSRARSFSLPPRSTRVTFPCAFAPAGMATLIADFDVTRDAGDDRVFDARRFAADGGLDLKADDALPVTTSSWYSNAGSPAGLSSTTVERTRLGQEQSSDICRAAQPADGAGAAFSTGVRFRGEKRRRLRRCGRALHRPCRLRRNGSGDRAGVAHDLFRLFDGWRSSTGPGRPTIGARGGRLPAPCKQVAAGRPGRHACRCHDSDRRPGDIHCVVLPPGHEARAVPWNGPDLLQDIGNCWGGLPSFADLSSRQVCAGV